MTRIPARVLTVPPPSEKVERSPLITLAVETLVNCTIEDGGDGSSSRCGGDAIVADRIERLPVDVNMVSKTVRKNGNVLDQ